MFKVRGIINGEEHSLKYENTNGKGQVLGDETAITVFSIVRQYEKGVGPIGQYMDRDVDIPLAALFIMMECFDSITGFEGDFPEVSEVPDGAIV